MSSRATELVRLLTVRGETLAVAESLTGGLVAAEITGVPGASRVFRGSITAYATELKHELLGVDATLLAQRGAVDPQVAAQMAAGARKALRADWGIATTGVAGPDPQDGVAPGTVHIGLSGPGVSTVRTITVSGDRKAVRFTSVEKALVLLSEYLLMTEDGNKR